MLFDATIFPHEISVADAVAMQKQQVQESRGKMAATLERSRTARALARDSGPGTLIERARLCHILPNIINDIDHYHK